MINVEIFYSVSVPQTSTFILPTFGVPKMKIKVFVPQTPTLIQYWHKELNILFCSMTPTNLGQFSKPGADLKSAGPDIFKTPPTCAI